MPTMNTTKVKRLKESIAKDMKELRKFRENRVSFIRQMIGKNYSDRGTYEKVPLNLIELTVNTYTNHLVAQTPAASVTTPHKNLKPIAYSLKLAIDHLANEIDLGCSLKKATVDSLFSIGIMKTGINYSSTVELGGFKHDVGQPFADPVQLDDFIFDTKAYSWEQCSYMGDRVKLPIQDLKKCGLYKKSVVNKIKPMEDDYMKDAREGERSSELSNNQEYPHAEDFYGMCQVWNIWLPRENLIVTLVDDEGITEPLAVEEWYGPEGGPYDVLDYSYVPGNCLPLAPISSLVDLHELTNKLFNKVARQAERQKTILGYKGSGVGDAQRIVDGNDGMAIRMDDPKSASEFRYGGPDQNVMGFVMQLRNYFSMFAGNLDSIGGLGPQADTAKQEELIKQSSSQRISGMSDKVVGFTGKIMNKLAFYLWNDPLINMPLVKRVEGTDLEIPFNFTREMQEGDFMEYNIDIVPYSLKQQTPSQKVQAVVEAVNMYAPFAQQMQQQGMKIDFKKMNDIIAEYKNLPELKEVIVSGEPEDPYKQPVGEANPKVQQQQKKYEHTYQSQGSVQGTEAQFGQAMFGSQGGGSQMGNQPMTGGMQ